MGMELERIEIEELFGSWIYLSVSLDRVVVSGEEVLSIYHVLVNTLKRRANGNDFSAQNTINSVYVNAAKDNASFKRQTSPNTQSLAPISSLEIPLPHGDPSLGVSATPTPPFQPHQLTCSISGPNAPTSQFHNSADY